MYRPSDKLKFQACLDRSAVSDCESISVETIIFIPPKLFGGDDVTVHGVQRTLIGITHDQLYLRYGCDRVSVLSRMVVTLELKVAKT